MDVKTNAKSENDLVINGVCINRGQRLTMNLEIGKLYTHTPVTIPIHVISGKQPGPRVFVCAAIHGDEINGVEIIRRLLKLTILRKLHVHSRVDAAVIAVEEKLCQKEGDY